MVSFGVCFLSQGSFDSSILETMCLSNVKVLSVFFVQCLVSEIQ